MGRRLSQKSNVLFARTVGGKWYEAGWGRFPQTSLCWLIMVDVDFFFWKKLLSKSLMFLNLETAPTSMKLTSSSPFLSACVITGLLLFGPPAGQLLTHGMTGPSGAHFHQKDWTAVISFRVRNSRSCCAILYIQNADANVDVSVIDDILHEFNGGVHTMWTLVGVYSVIFLDGGQKKKKTKSKARFTPDIHEYLVIKNTLNQLEECLTPSSVTDTKRCLDHIICKEFNVCGHTRSACRW